MASVNKHKKRSSRSYRTNSIPVNKFYANAEKVRQAKATRQFYKQIAENASEKVEAEVVE